MMRGDEAWGARRGEDGPAKSRFCHRAIEVFNRLFGKVAMEANLMRQNIQGHWASIRRRAESGLERMSLACCHEAIEMVVLLVRRFCSQPAPQNDDELNQRFMQSAGLSVIIATVSHAESMGSPYPHRKEDRLRLVREMCSIELPNTGDEYGRVNQVRMGVSMRIASLAADERMMANRR